MKKKVIALALGCTVALGCAIGGTLAWLTDTTDEVMNVFTDSDINVTLTETTTDYKMIPGWTIEKDPIVTVKAGSEDCWVFIKVEESASPKLDDFIEYKIDPNNWTQLKNNDNEDVEGVYYCYAKDITADRSIKVLGYTDTKGTNSTDDDEFVPNQVKVLDSVTKEMMDDVEKNGKPTLTFTAYASQLMQNNTEEFKPYEAWLNVQPDPVTP